MKITNMYMCLIIASIVYGCSEPTRSSKVGRDVQISKSDTMIKQPILSFKQIINTIEKKVVDLTAVVDLLNIKEFVDLFESPEIYQDDALKFLSTDSNTSQQKMIAIYSMQKLPENKYINFMSKATSMYQNAPFMDDYLLFLIIAADFSIEDPIIRNYDNSEVVMSLNKIKGDKKTTSNLKKWIDKILSGEAWEDRKEDKKENK